VTTPINSRAGILPGDRAVVQPGASLGRLGSAEAGDPPSPAAIFSDAGELLDLPEFARANVSRFAPHLERCG